MLCFVDQQRLVEIELNGIINAIKGFLPYLQCDEIMSINATGKVIKISHTEWSRRINFLMRKFEREIIDYEYICSKSNNITKFKFQKLQCIHVLNLKFK